MKQMEFEAKLDKRDLFWLGCQPVIENPSTYCVCMSISAAVAVVLPYYLPLPLWGAALLYLALSALAYGAWLLSAFRRAAKSYDAFLTNTGYQRTVLTDRYYAELCGRDPVKLDWDELLLVREDRKFYHLFTQPRRCSLIPKRLLSPEARELFARKIEEDKLAVEKDKRRLEESQRPEGVRVHTVRTGADMAAFRLFYHFQYKRLLTFVMPLCLILIVVLTNPGSWQGYLLPALFLVTLAALDFWIVRLMKQSADGEPETPMEFVLGDTQLYVKTARGELLVDWDTLYWVVSVRKTTYLFIDDNQAFILPARDLTPRVQERLVELTKKYGLNKRQYHRKEEKKGILSMFDQKK